MFFMDYATVRRLRARKFIYTLSGVAPAANGPSGGALPLEQKIQQGSDFWSELLNIEYTTLNNAGADDGATTLLVQFQDGNNQLGMSNTEIDCSLISAPGRQRAGGGLAGDPSNALAIPGLPYPHLWLGTGAIIANVRNSSNTANTIKFAFQGYLIPEAQRRAFDEWVGASNIMPPPPPANEAEVLGNAMIGYMNRLSGR